MWNSSDSEKKKGIRNESLSFGLKCGDVGTQRIDIHQHGLTLGDLLLETLAHVSHQLGIPLFLFFQLFFFLIRMRNAVKLRAKSEISRSRKVAEKTTEN